MNHAFLIQVHKEPVLFGRIIRSLEASNHYFFINVDRKVDDEPFKKEAAGIEHVFYLEGKERQEVNWGGFLKLNVHYNYFAKSISPPCKI